MAVAIDSANGYRQTVGELLAVYKKLMSIDKEYVALSIGTNVIDAELGDITVIQFTDGVTAAQAIMAAIETNKTNLYTVSDGSQR